MIYYYCQEGERKRALNSGAKKISTIFAKPLDKYRKMWYNIYVRTRAELDKRRRGQTMTNREFYTNIINGNINEETLAHATAELAKLDARNDKRRNTMTKEQIANEAIKKDIVEVIGTGSKTASEIASALAISTQKVSALAKQLVDDGTLTKHEVAVKGKGKVLAYELANVE